MSNNRKLVEIRFTWNDRRCHSANASHLMNATDLLKCRFGIMCCFGKRNAESCSGFEGFSILSKFCSINIIKPIQWNVEKVTSLGRRTSQYISESKIALFIV